MSQTQYQISYFSSKSLEHNTKYRNCCPKSFEPNAEFRNSRAKGFKHNTNFRIYRTKCFKHNSKFCNSRPKGFKHSTKFCISRPKSFKHITKFRVLSKSFKTIQISFFSSKKFQTLANFVIVVQNVSNTKPNFVFLFEKFRTQYQIS